MLGIFKFYKSTSLSEILVEESNTVMVNLTKVGYSFSVS